MSTKSFNSLVRIEKSSVFNDLLHEFSDTVEIMCQNPIYYYFLSLIGDNYVITKSCFNT